MKPQRISASKDWVEQKEAPKDTEMNSDTLLMKSKYLYLENEVGVLKNSW